MTIPLKQPQRVEPHAGDYAIVAEIIGRLHEAYREQPSLDDLSRWTGQSPFALQKLFTRWAGLSPKAFLQAVTMDHAKRLLRDGADLLDATYDLGLSSPGRLHDLFVTHEAMSPGIWKARGEGLTIDYGWAESPFGPALVMATERGLCGLAFAEETADDATYADMTRRWPRADYRRDDEVAARYAARIFDPREWRADRPLRITLIGTDFQISVWEGLLDIPMDRTESYGSIASRIDRPKAARAVGAAIGANPISFVVPCHRAIGKDGSLTGYHWGVTRKRAILGWEAGTLSSPAAA